MQLIMVINESLCLYPRVVMKSREALKDIKFGDIHVPKGVIVWAVVTSLHTDSEIPTNLTQADSQMECDRGMQVTTSVHAVWSWTSDMSWTKLSVG